MIPSLAIIRSVKSDVTHNKVCGLYPLERNIRLLWHAGIKELRLDLNDADMKIYDKIRHRIRKLRDMKVVLLKNHAGNISKKHIVISSALFFQYHHIVKFDEFFREKGKVVQPVRDKGIFILENSEDIRYAEKIAMEHIRVSAGGVIARNINKRISLPISMRLARLGIHPNYITLFNFLFMLTGALMLWKNEYLWLLAAGTIFQLASIFDGCDGEVAKLTCTFSKSGAVFDTVNDYTCLIVYLAGASYLYYHKAGTFLTGVTIAIVFGGLFVIMGAVILYLVKYSLSKSFAAFAREFLGKLPKSDPIVFLTVKLQYFIRKEFYSWVAFLMAIPGLLYLMIPYTAITVIVAAFLCIALEIKYFPKLSREKSRVEMTYISQRS